jgi:hypothetical protein
MVKRTEFTLSEASRLLGEPQHKLIYLCEKGVVLPDLAEASGRGTSRRFSARNVLEFAISLKLREFMLPAAFIKAVIYVLRQFERRVGEQMPEFSLPESLRTANAPDFRMVITDGPQLFFTLGRKNGPQKTCGGIDLKDLITKRRTSATRSPEELNSEGCEDAVRSFGNAPEHRDAPYAKTLRFEMNVTRLAMELSLSE